MTSSMTTRVTTEDKDTPQDAEVDHFLSSLLPNDANQAEQVKISDSNEHEALEDALLSDSNEHEALEDALLSDSNEHEALEDALLSDLLMPPHPQEPLQSDCCGTGCTPCVFDLYDQEVAVWKDECERIRHGGSSVLDGANSQVILSPDKYTKFLLDSVRQETSLSYRYVFTIPGYQALPLSVGQHLVLRWQTSDKVLTRQYTPISSPETKGKMEFIIKIYPDGEMSQYIKSWKPGDLVEWRGPFGNFTYKYNSYKHIVMFTAGTGIAPIIQLIHRILSYDDEETRLHLVYACRDYSAILCKNLLDKWTDYWNFSVIYVLSQDNANRSTLHRYGDQVIYGRLTQQLVSSYVVDYLPSVRILVCGTKSFDKDIINYLKTTDIPDTAVFKF